MTNENLLSHKKIIAKKRAFTVFKYFMLVILGVFFVFPFLYLFTSSLMTDEQILNTTSIIPKTISFDAYKILFEHSELLVYVVNTLIVCALNISGVCIMSSLTAFGLCKVKFKGQDLVFTLILATLLLPGTVTGVPLFTIYAKLGLTGTLVPLWLPIWFGGGATNIFLIRQFMRGIPKSYSEAAIIDGASSFTIYTSVVLPLVKPIIIYLAVTNFMGLWNDFQTPLMYVGDNPAKYTLSLALYQEFAREGSSYFPNVQMALGVLMAIPCIVLFALFQKQLMEGVSAVGIKG
ncbi:MAG: carbohydrate ABC transporter permease [Clostridia bacterium]|nr:carbohydrate ABC transporter permease [Clostridia bacterium]